MFEVSNFWSETSNVFFLYGVENFVWKIIYSVKQFVYNFWMSSVLEKVTYLLKKMERFMGLPLT